MTTTIIIMYQLFGLATDKENQHTSLMFHAWKDQAMPELCEFLMFWK